MLSTAGNGARQKRAQRIGFNRIIRCKKVRLCRKRKESRAAATSTGFRKLRFLQDPRRIHSARQYRKALSRNLPHTAGNVIYDFRRNHDRCAGFNFPIAFLFSLFQKNSRAGNEHRAPTGRPHGRMHCQRDVFQRRFGGSTKIAGISGFPVRSCESSGILQRGDLLDPAFPLQNSVIRNKQKLLAGHTGNRKITRRRFHRKRQDCC